MNKMGKLIKAKMIDFIGILIKNYRLINLDEVDTILIAKLYYLAEEHNTFLDLKRIAKEMRIAENDLANHVLTLVSKGYIELDIKEDGKECFSLDGVIDKLGLVLENDQTVVIEEREEKLSMIVNYIESVYLRNCTANDLMIVNNWLDLGYDYEMIKNAVLQSVKLNKLNLKYVEAILASKKAKEVKPKLEIDDELVDLLNNAYVKK